VIVKRNLNVPRKDYGKAYFKLDQI